MSDSHRREHGEVGTERKSYGWKSFEKVEDRDTLGRDVVLVLVSGEGFEFCNV